MTDYIRKYRNQFVRVAYLLMAISFILNVSCATMIEKRYVENNTFISTYPKMAIKVSPELKYLDRYHEHIIVDPTDEDFRRGKTEIVFHIFLQKGEEGDINKGLAIATLEAEEGFHWGSDSVMDPQKAMDSGEIDISGKAWPYAIFASKNFLGVPEDFLQKHGFSTNQNFLVAVISKVVDHSPGSEALGSIKMAILYTEDQRICGSDSAAFMARFLKAVQFPGTDFAELIAAIPKTDSPELTIPFYIFIEQDDEVYAWRTGRLKYRVQKGDVLEVVRKLNCWWSGLGECWMVFNVKTEMFGYVNPNRMKGRHSFRKELGNEK